MALASEVGEISLKKTFFYNFYPAKAEEEEEVVVVSPREYGYHRMLVEIRDIRPPPQLDPRQPWQIKKTLDQYEVSVGKVLIPFHEAFEYILRYWNIFICNHLAILGHKIAVVVWDVSDTRQPKKYQGEEVSFQVSPCENYFLACLDLMRDRKLKVHDSVGLHWDPSHCFFRIKVFYSNSNMQY